MEKRYFSIEEAAEYVGVCKAVFRRSIMTRPGFPLIRVSPRRIIIPADRLDEWMNAQIKTGVR